MSYKLPRTLQAVPNTLHARREIADAIRQLFRTELRKAGFDPDEPRVPAGNAQGEQWTNDGRSRSWIDSVADWFRHTSDPEWAEAQNIQDLVENHPRAAIISGSVGLAIPFAPAAAFMLTELLGAGVTAEGPAATLALAQRIANVESYPMFFRRTISLLETAEGPTLVAGGGTDLSPAQIAVARQLGLTPITGLSEHAEMTAISGARSHPKSRRYDKHYLCRMRRQDTQDGRMAHGGPQLRVWTVTMNENQLIDAIRERSARPELRTDFADRLTTEVSVPATIAAVHAAERALGYGLHPFHRRLLTEVGNGGFGPGAGLIGLPGGAPGVDGHFLVEFSRLLLLEPGASSLPGPIVVLCDWGCGVWGCIDCETGAVLTIAEDGLKDSGQTVCAWFEDWVSGVTLWRRVFEVRQQLVQDPSTKQPRWEESARGTLGVPYVRRR